MRSLARQSSRWANASYVRQSSLPRHRLDGQQRAFVASTIRPDDVRPPNGPPSRHTPVSESRQPPRSVESAEARNDAEGHESGEVKPGIEPRKSGGRRTFRQRRVESVPKPPPIPEWFLRHNVKLVEERTSRIEDHEVEIQTVHCIDTETGHTLFSVPYHRSTEPSLSNSGRKKSEQPAAEAKETKEASTSPSKPVNQPAKATKSELGEDFFEQKYNAISQKSVKLQFKRQEPSAVAFEPPAKDQGVSPEWRDDPMRWLFLEAETSIRAAFSFADDSQPLSRYATDQVDVSLQCPDPNSHEEMDVFVHDLANIVNADVIQLDANDFAELTDEYVGQGDDKPGSYSNLAYDVFHGYEATASDNKSPSARPREDEYEDDEMDEDDDIEEEDNRGPHGIRGPQGFPFARIIQGSDMKKLLQGLGKSLGGRIVGARIGVPGQIGIPTTIEPRRPTTTSSDANKDERLSALFDHVLNAVTEKRANPETFKKSSEFARMEKDRDNSAFWQETLRILRANSVTWLPDTARSILLHLGLVFHSSSNDPTKIPYRLVSEAPISVNSAKFDPPDKRQTIVYIRDLDDVYDNKIGQGILRSLFKSVMKRRRSGERIVIVGATAADVPAPPPMMTAEEFEDELSIRTIQISPFFKFTSADNLGFLRLSPQLDEKNLDEPSYDRILEINIRHIQSMLRRMRPNDNVDVSSQVARKQLNLPGTHFLTERVLPLDQIQRLALLAIGLAQLHAKAEKIQSVHVAMAAFISQRSDHVNHSWSLFKDKKQKKESLDGKTPFKAGGKPEGESGQARIDRVKKLCNPHETKLLHGVVDSHKIKTGYGDVHAPIETIDALKTLTSLSLLRPDAFTYGVLANDRLPGLLLYGPPGTGKTLLAKAVAKESKAAVLEVSGAEIYDKYVGEGEKMVRAVFSLAKKLSPCVVFIDEADAIFGSRGQLGNRTTHREIINQFLREWDGMDDHSVFMMVATNRPFDLDDAVLRRLPRRLLVDLPVAKDRESILKIHLRGEMLDSSVSLSDLAERTPYYSGSDLKNLAVAAALACVREENDLAESQKGDETFKLPEKRTLTQQHFDKALTEISASISEDMSTLTRIRKFDEDYGDRKNKRKKTKYGFGITDQRVDESAVMVRQAGASQSPPAP